MFARFDDIPGHEVIGAVIIEEGTEGWTIESRAGVPRMPRRSARNLNLSDVRIPAENVILGAGKFVS